ncbi:MAG: ATP-binding protein [Actinomycetota bacterium]
MRFTIREGSGPHAVADATMLRALGMPHGGVVSVGDTHLRVSGGDVTGPTDLQLPDELMSNAGLKPGASVDVKRAILPAAEVVRFVEHDLEPRVLARALQGSPITVGDRITIEAGYFEGTEDAILEVTEVVPESKGTVGAGTRFAKGGEPAEAAPAAAPTASSPTTATPPGPGETGPPTAPAEPAEPPAPTTADALLAGLDNEVDLITGWFSLLATSDNLAASWNMPSVAGMLLEGPNGCGKSELVTEAATRAGSTVTEVDISRVFKPERLLDRLSSALNAPRGPRVIFVDRLEQLTGDDALSTYRTQFIAVLRWFLEEVADKPQVACVLGVESTADLHESLAKSPLLPRTVSIPPPDLDRRELLFEAAFAHVPGSDDVDAHRLATLSSGFSGADVLAAVLQASAMITAPGEKLTTDLAVQAVEGTSPSLGSVPLGQITGFGFEKVANMAEAKQRLTEAVIWPMTQPERYERLGIEPPKGILLWGPPGTGKTFIIKALAHEAGSAFFAVKGAELLDKYVGESERAVRTVFQRARDAAPSIIFFDEFDALAPVRGSSSSSVSDQVVAALLTEIDGVADRGQVSVIAATNRKDLIDGALLRAGRFESHIEIGLPAAEARLALLNITDVALSDDVDLAQLAEDTEGLSFADLTGVLREAALETLRSDETATEVGPEALQRALRLFDDRRGAATTDG